MKDFQAVERPLYNKKLLRLLDSKRVIFVTGVRRSGKSCIALQFEKLLRDTLGEEENIVRVDFEKISTERYTKKEIDEIFLSKYALGGPTVFILDEVSHVADWEKSVNLEYRRSNNRLIIVSSVRSVISDKVDAVRSGDYGVIDVLPLSLGEFVNAHSFTDMTGKAERPHRRRYIASDGAELSLQEVYDLYTKYGGLPVITPEYLDTERVRLVWDGSYSSIVVKDVLEADSGSVSDPALLRDIIRILARSTGDNLSATGIAKTVSDEMPKKVAVKTVEHYMRTLINAHLFYMAERFDIRAGQRLKTLSKFYVVDVGLQNYVTGARRDARAATLENKVYFELIRRGYQVFNGKIGSDEVDFIAVNGRSRIYIQVAGSLDTKNQSALLTPLRRIRDNYPKMLISFDDESGTTKDGILTVNALDFLMGDSPIGQSVYAAG